MTKSRLIQWAGIALSLVVIWLLVRSLRIDRVIDALAEADYWWLVPAVAISLTSFIFRAQRFRIFLLPIQHFGLWRAYNYIAINYMGNNVLPARAGEVLLSYVVKKQERIPLSSSLAVTVLGRVGDGLLLLLVLLISFWFLSFPTWVNQVLFIGLVIFGLAMVGLLWLVFGRERHHQKLHRVAQSVTPGRLDVVVSRAVGQLKKFQNGISALRDRRVVLQSVALTLAIWLCEGLVYVTVGQSLSVGESAWQWVFVLAITNLASSIPSGPASIGTFEGVVIVVLGSGGVPLHQAAAYAVLLHVTQVVPVTLIGAAAYARTSVATANSTQ
jgi:uncharacterized protein (TIRG00374 family)